MSVELIHFNCVVCHASQLGENEPSGFETRVMLVMWRRDRETLEGMFRNLCFVHRLEIESAAKADPIAG